MTGKTRPISIRLAASEIEQLHARAHRLSANISGVARDLIRTGLAGGDNKALADRLMRIERRIVAIEQQGLETHTQLQSIDKTARDLLAMFEALLKALTGESSGRAA
jgi:predicted  nucleic acid-binding Zn-ribbon protein